MSAGYRDELEAELAAKESLQAQLSELQAQLNQAQNALGEAQSTLIQQQAMYQQWGAPAAAPQAEKRDPQIALVIFFAIVILFFAAAVIFFVLGSSSQSTPPSTVRVESVPVVPALADPAPQIVPEPEQPSTAVHPVVPAQRAAF